MTPAPPNEPQNGAQGDDAPPRWKFHDGPPPTREQCIRDAARVLADIRHDLALQAVQTNENGAHDGA